MTKAYWFSNHHLNLIEKEGHVQDGMFIYDDNNALCYTGYFFLSKKAAIMAMIANIDREIQSMEKTKQSVIKKFKHELA